MAAVTSVAVTPGRTAIWIRRAHQVASGPLYMLGPALLAAAVAFATIAAGFHGTDVAAQVYRVVQVRLHGLTLWDIGWYGGNYPLGYSVVYPLTGALIGVELTAVLSAGVAAFAFDRLVVDHFGRRPLASWYFAISVVVEVGVGQFSFLLGEAFGLLAVLAAGRSRWRLATILAALAGLSSPVDGVFVALAMGSWALASWTTSSRRRRSQLIAIGALAIGPVGIVGLIFSGTGPFPYSFPRLLGVLVLGALAATGVVKTTRPVRLGAILYALAAIAVFVIPNPLGDNASRLGLDVGVPLLICFVGFERRWRAAVLVIPFVLWQWAPGLGAIYGSGNIPANEQSFYQPLLAEMTAQTKGVPVRLEIPPTQDHWEAAYVAPYISLARGWERQLDIADNPVFYRPGALTPTSYHRWLLANGVSWVALPHTPLDYAAKGEARLLASHQVPDLRLAWHTAQWQLWKVTDSPGLVTGPARVTAMTADRLDLQVSKPAALTVRVRYTSYWSVSRGAACVSQTAQGWTGIKVREAGPVALTVSVLPAAHSDC
jgi:hypothetical protein